MSPPLPARETALFMRRSRCATSYLLSAVKLLQKPTVSRRARPAVHVPPAGARVRPACWFSHHPSQKANARVNSSYPRAAACPLERYHTLNQSRRACDAWARVDSGGGDVTPLWRSHAALITGYGDEGQATRLIWRLFILSTVSIFHSLSHV